MQNKELTEMENHLRQLPDEELVRAFIAHIGRERIIKVLVELCRQEALGSNSSKISRVKSTRSQQEFNQAILWVIDNFQDLVERRDGVEQAQWLIVQEAWPWSADAKGEGAQKTYISVERFALRFIDIILDTQSDKIQRIIKRSDELNLGFSDWLRASAEGGLINANL